MFTLEALLEFRWEVALGGLALTQEELDLLSEAKRPLVRLRGRWVLADPVLPSGSGAGSRGGCGRATRSPPP